MGTRGTPLPAGAGARRRGRRASPLRTELSSAGTKAWARGRWRHAGALAGAQHEPERRPEAGGAGLAWLEPGVPVCCTEDGALGVVWAGPITRPILKDTRDRLATSEGVVRLLLNTGLISGWRETAGLERPTKRQVRSLVAEMKLHDETAGMAHVVFDALKADRVPAQESHSAGAYVAASESKADAWIELGVAVRRSNAWSNAVGVVCSELDSAGDVKLLLEDGSLSGWVNASTLRPEAGAGSGWLPAAASLLSAVRVCGTWRGAPVRRKRNGALGVLTQHPDRDGDVTVLNEDGSTSGFMKLTSLERPSTLELAEQHKWLADAKRRLRGS